MGFLDKLFGKANKDAVIEAVAASAGQGVVCSPVTGTAVALADVPDPVFGSGAMGKGCGVKPSAGVAYAPVTGEITAAFPTGHAFGITSDDGIEVLIHIGMDTVDMNGKGFKIIAQQGAHVKAGDPLGTFTPSDIKAAGHDDTVIVVITNSDDYKDVACVAEGSVTAGDALLRTEK